MAELLHELVAHQARLRPDAEVLCYRDEVFSYGDLWAGIGAVAQGLLRHDLKAGERVAVFLPKLPQTVLTLLGASAAGCVFVPVNPLLKPRQVGYILRDCNVRVLVTSMERFGQLEIDLADCPDLRALVLVDAEGEIEVKAAYDLLSWNTFTAVAQVRPPHRRIDMDMVAILYTSGSTGQPKGVVLSHRNMLAGARSVASYLHNTSEDRVLAVLPLSFDAGLSQLTTMFAVGGCAVLMDYLLPQDVLRALVRYRITGLAGVPPIWNQLVRLQWPEAIGGHLRYITNTGGAMPTATTRSLAARLPNTHIYLMYGLTEAFRSTYLPPDQVSVRPESIGKAIPNAEILVINEQGEECAPHEPGELVHRGALVSMGYWNAPEKTAERFRPCPGRQPELGIPELAVWSGDRVYRDEQGFLYFVSRADEMIKTSGYRVSPSEVEEVIHDSGLVAEVAVIGSPHAMLGQAIIALAIGLEGASGETLVEGLLAHCRRELPNFMVPLAILACEELPTNQNGKIDRKALADQYRKHFEDL
jgi:acyl-CoA ligase (AMP-forming) (exosortase A-associated)